jgi:hypothetical protein
MVTIINRLHLAACAVRALAIAVTLLVSVSAAQSPNHDSTTKPHARTPVHPWLAPAVAAATASAAAGSGDDEGWAFSVAPYGFLSSLDGQRRVGDRSVDVDRSFSEIADVLKFAAGIRIEAQHEKFGFAFDNNYMKLGDDITTDRLIAPDFRFDLSLNVTEIEPRYRLWSTGDQDEPVGGPELAFDVIGGVRIVHFETDLLVRRLVLADERRLGSSTYVHGYVGPRIVVSPWRYATFEGRFNFALASDFSWFGNANVDVRPWEHISFGGGIQVLDLSLENDSAEAALDARLAGPILYAKFHF